MTFADYMFVVCIAVNALAVGVSVGVAAYVLSELRKP
jgi:hypothetical protein